jgi:simple sugar transport system permease protein
MKMKRKIDSKTIQLAVICVLLFAVMAFIRPKFISSANIYSMMMQIGMSGLFAVCIAIAYLSRGIDLSIISIANLVGIISGVIFRNLLTEASSPAETTAAILLCVLISIVAGMLCGLINGALIAELGIFPILVTLATQNIFMGISMIITQGRAETNIPKPLIELADTSILKIGGFRGIPLILLLFLAIYIFMSVVVHRTPFGYKLQWHGSNSRVSFFNAINNKKVVYITYIISGAVAALGGFIVMGRTGSAKADYGGNAVFQALLTCVLAGISPLGGRGKIYNLLLSLMALQFLSTGFNMLRISPLIRDSLYGFLLVFSIMTEYVLEKRRVNLLNRSAILEGKMEVSNPGP